MVAVFLFRWLGIQGCCRHRNATAMSGKWRGEVLDFIGRQSTKISVSKDCFAEHLPLVRV